MDIEQVIKDLLNEDDEPCNLGKQEIGKVIMRMH